MPRATSKTVQLNTAISRDLRLRFHRKCIADGIPMHRMISILIRLYIQGMIADDQIDLVRAKIEKKF